MYTSPILLEALSLQERQYQNQLLDEVNELLMDKENSFKELLENETYRIFSLETIEKICLRYRLRFLDLELFKGDVPPQAQLELNELESRYRTKFRRLRIIAPGEFFELGHIDKDPILLAELSKDKYLFIHKWGGEFNWWRKVQAFPFRTVTTGLISICMLSVILSIVLAGAMAGFKVSPVHLLFSVFHLTLAGSLFAVFISLAFSIYPTRMMWKSKFLDF